MSDRMSVFFQHVRSTGQETWNSVQSNLKSLCSKINILWQKVQENINLIIVPATILFQVSLAINHPTIALLTGIAGFIMSMIDPNNPQKPSSPILLQLKEAGWSILTISAIFCLSIPALGTAVTGYIGGDFLGYTISSIIYKTKHKEEVPSPDAMEEEEAERKGDDAISVEGSHDGEDEPSVEGGDGAPHEA